nr:uncharacterized protein LOC123749834 [Procambarus clarkii]
MTREHLEREYQKARAAMIQRNEYLKRLLNVEEPNSIKVTNKKQKKDNIQDVSHINSKQRPAAPQSDGKVCVQCTNCEASIKCEDCFAFLCHICDQMQHFLMPFHHRLYWKNGFYEPLDPTQTVCPEGNIFHWRRYDLYTPIYTCHCGYEHQQLGKTMHKSGFYSSLGKSSTFYSTSLLESWHHIKRNCPGTSFRALVTALESFGASRGRIGPINYITSKRVFFEWRFQQYELRKIRGEADNECPACDKTPLAVHIDGNKKLYRYNKPQAKPFLGVLHAKGHAWYCQVLYGGRWQEGSGMTLGEEAEQVFAYLSRYNSTTKNMLKAERTEELTEGAVFWNHRKIDGLARALVTRLRKARETEITVSNEIDKLDVQKSLIQEWRSDLQMICKELELNTGTTSKNIKYSIEAVADSIRHRKNLIATDAASSKMRSSLRHRNECDRKKLQGFIKIYNSENSEILSEKDAIEGILPWHNLLPHHSQNVSLAQKKKAVEDVELQKRSREEQQHTVQEMLHYLAYYKNKREILTEHTEELLCGIFPSYLSKDPNKYTIEEKHLSTKNKSGILALLKQGQKMCSDKLSDAKRLFGYQEEDVDVSEPYLELCDSEDDDDEDEDLLLNS